MNYLLLTSLLQICLVESVRFPSRFLDKFDFANRKINQPRIYIKGHDHFKNDERKK